MKYYFSPKIDWETFKLLQEKFSYDPGPVPEHADEMLHKMLVERKINLYLDTKQPEDPIIITTEDIPENATMLTNPSN